jgi:catechol 2,3-dioxygenase-like lactoylglutathione lyase family enzyme
MAQIAGFHHVSLPATDVERSGDWYERVFGFECVLVTEEEDHVKAVMLVHPAGMLLSVHQVPDLVTHWYGSPGGPAVLGFLVGSRDDLARWDKQLTELEAEHSSPRRAHLGWALDVIDPSGLRIQLHTREVISADDE